MEHLTNTTEREFINWHAQIATNFTYGGQTEISTQYLMNIETILSMQKANPNSLITPLRKATKWNQ
jgi:hypothetical protein